MISLSSESFLKLNFPESTETAEETHFTKRTSSCAAAPSATRRKPWASSSTQVSLTQRRRRRTASRSPYDLPPTRLASVCPGHETKAMLNNNGPRYKRSKLERQMNVDVCWSVVILLVMCLFVAIGMQNFVSYAKVSHIAVKNFYPIRGQFILCFFFVIFKCL